MAKGMEYYTLQKDKIIDRVVDYLRQNPQSWHDLAVKMGISPHTLKRFVNKTQPPYFTTVIKIDNFLDKETKEGRFNEAF